MRFVIEGRDGKAGHFRERRLRGVVGLEGGEIEIVGGENAEDLVRAPSGELVELVAGADDFVTAGDGFVEEVAARRGDRARCWSWRERSIARRRRGMTLTSE